MIKLSCVADDDRLLLCTGGDDNSVVVTLCDVTSCSVVNQGKHETAHSSQVSGVKFIREDLLLSASIDQRLVLWKIGGDLQVARDVLQFVFVMSCTYEHL